MDADRQKTYRSFFVLGALLLLLALFLFLIRHLIITVVLAATFSGLLFPFRARLELRLKGHGTLATIVVLVSAFIVIVIPLSGILAIVARQAVQVSESLIPYVKEHVTLPVNQWVSFIENLPFIRELRPFQLKVGEGLSQLIQMGAGQVSTIFSEAALGAVDFVIKLFIGIFAAFFFLRDGARMVNTAKGFIPLTDEEVHDTIDKGLLIIRATIKSLFVIGFIQGGLIALAFWFFGIPAPLFWGFIVAISSVIPGIGAPLVWIPAVVYLIFSGQWIGAIVLGFWGAVPVGLTDNYLRPIIIGRGVDVPELYILLSIFGGLTTFGVSGIILGPVLASVLVSALEIFRRVYR